MRLNKVAILPVILLTIGCASMKEFIHKDRARQSSQADEAVTTQSVPESPIINQGSGYDRVSGTDYVWGIRENGAIQLSWDDSGDISTIVVTDRGDMMSHLHGRTWEYSTSSVTCDVGETILKGLLCIHPVVQDFFTNHQFKPPHPMMARIR